MPIIVEQNTTNAELFLSVSGAGAKVVPTLEELRRALAETPDEHAVVLGPAVDLEAAAALADNLRITRPAVSVILMRRRVDTSVLAEALRSGMREVVEERDLNGLSDAIKRAFQVYRAVTGPSSRLDEAPVGRVVTVFSPKGGVGKTTIAANLAVALATRDNTRVCLVDLDLGFGDVAITLQLFPARTIADAVALESDLDFAALEPLLTPHRRGFSTLVAPVQPDAKDSIPASLVSRILSILKANFEFVVVDTSPAFDEHVLQAFDETDELLLVTTLDVPTLKNVKIACETLDLLNFPKARRHLVLNRADDKVGLAPEKVETTLDMKIDQAIPTSPEVANATNAGEPITASHPKHTASQALFRLAGDGRARPPRQEPKRAEARASPPPGQVGGTMSSLADRLAAASRDRAIANSSSTELESKGPNGGRAKKPEVRDTFRELKATVHNRLLQELGPKLYDANLTQAELERMVRGALQEAMHDEDVILTPADRTRIAQEIADDILGYGPIEPFLRDPDLTEVMVNGCDDIWIERSGKLQRVDGRFNDEQHLRRTIDKIVSRIGRRVDESSPMVDARLPDGSRVNAVIPPLAIDGSLLTIRKFSADPYTADDLVAFGTMSARTAEFLDACVRGKLNVIVSGSTGAGKTTTLNVLSSFIPSDERIITIEDAAELQLHQDHVLRLESRPANIEGKGAIDIRDLVKNSLRMRPDRIVVGEVRDSAALDMLQAMNTGHDGSICTVHSNGPRDTLARIETMVLMAGMDLPIKAIREQVASAVDLIVHQARLRDGSRRITHVTEVERMEGDVITLQDVFLYDHSKGFDENGRSLGSLRATGLRPKFLEKLAHNNVHVDPMIFARDGA